MKTDTKNNDLKKDGDVLVCVPRTNDGGGANYFNSLKHLMPSNVVYFYRGKSNWPASKGFFYESLRLINDYISYCFLLIRRNFKIVHVNTLFGGYGVLRDAVFILLAKIMRKKLIVFFRGWDWKFSAKEKEILFKLIKLIYLKADALIVLSSDEKNQLRSWGYNKLIFQETTTVDWSLIQGISIDNIVKKYDRITELNLLFLSRVHKEKGIYETVEAFQILQNKYSNLRLTIAGKGPELDNVKKYVANNNIDNIQFLGFVSGDQKVSTYQKAHTFLFPSYSEGMPNAVLEAFAFGLPVIATNVGGLKDIFHDGENGLIVKMKNVEDLAEKIEMLINDPSLMKKIALKNYDYAMEKFISNKVAERIQDIYKSLS